MQRKYVISAPNDKRQTMQDANWKDDEMELQLWAYIDGILPDQEQGAVAKLIADHSAWKEKYAELLLVHESLMDMELEQPSMRFTKNVMEEIAKLQIAPAAKEYINQKIVWGIAAFFVTIIVGFVGYAISQINWASGEGVNNDLLTKVTSADYSKVFSNTFVNGFLMANVILGLMLFDRYLDNKKKEMMKTF